MRIIVNCAGGASHSLMLLEQTTVQDVKDFVGDKEGIPAANQALLFAGRVLGPDSALLLEELHLNSFSLSNEVVVYMQPQLSQPVRVYLSTQPGGSNAKQSLFPEVVEASSTLTNIQQLLEQRQLTCMPFPPPAQGQNGSTGGAAAAAGSAHGSARTSSSSSGGRQAGAGAIGSSNVVVKRQDGSCCSKVQVEEGCTMQELLEALWEVEVEGKCPTSLTFFQAADGCLHAVYGASN